MENLLLKKLKLEQTYLACFNEFKSGWEISNDIKGYYHNSYLQLIYKFPDYFETKSKKFNKSWKNDKHRAKIEPLIEIIESIVKINKTDKRKLTTILESKNFREPISYKNGFHSIFQVLNYIQTVAGICYASEKYTEYQQKKGANLKHYKGERKRNIEKRYGKKAIEIVKQIDPKTFKGKAGEDLDKLYLYIIGEKFSKMKLPTLQKLTKLTPGFDLVPDFILSTIAVTEATK